MLKLMYITNRPEVAAIAENAGVERILSIWNISAKAKDRAEWTPYKAVIR